MKIGKPEIRRRGGDEVTFRVDVRSSAGPEALWYSLPGEFGDLMSESCDAPLAALLVPAMARGEDVHVDGAVSETLLDELSRPYQRVLRHLLPSLRPIDIYPAETRSGDRRPPGVATGFSGGVDSYCTLADYHYFDAPPATKITHLLFNNVGSHGAGGERLFRERYDALKQAADRTRLPFVMVNSNLDEFYKGLFTFQETHTLRNASVALLLQEGVGRFIYSSTYCLPDVFVGPTYDMAHSDPVALPLLSTDRVEMRSVGGEYTRVEKTLRIADVPETHETLEVCVREERVGNCSECWKCMRTLLTLEIAGLIERYAAAFDLDRYRRRRSRYLGEVLRSRDPLLREIVQFADARDYPFPARSRLSARMHYPATQAKRLARLPVRAARKLRNATGGTGPEASS